MAFLDDLGKKISQTGQDVVQKTKDTADVLKFSAAISDEEKLVNDLFRQLGKAYFENNADAPDPAFEKIVEAIKASNKKIEDYKNQINILKGISICTVCGAEVHAGVAFCSSCGSKVEMKQRPANSNVCVSCGAPLSPNSAFCTNCGTKVVAPKLCPNCGNNIGDSAFCTNCGTKIQQATPAPTPTVAPAPVQNPTPVQAPAPVQSAPVQQPAPTPVVEAAPVAPQNTKVCHNCHFVITDNSAFCTNCGTKLDAPKPVVNEPIAEQTVNVCPNCSFTVDSNSAFCTNCGTRLR